jgi:hypothetical protein
MNEWGSATTAAWVFEQSCLLEDVAVDAAAAVAVNDDKTSYVTPELDLDSLS